MKQDFHFSLPTYMDMKVESKIEGEQIEIEEVQRSQ
jgi:hypothetical protein